MFSPATKKSNFSARKDRNLGHTRPDSPITPLAENRSSLHDTSIPNRPSTGTPAPWASRLSVIARIPPVKKTGNSGDIDLSHPVYIGELPQVVQDEQALLLKKRAPGDLCISGGIDQGTSLAWIICGNRLFIWSCLSSAASRKCVNLEIPARGGENGDFNINTFHKISWSLCVVNWDNTCRDAKKVVQQCNSCGIVLCNLKTRAVIFWPDVYSECGTTLVMSLDDGPNNCSIKSGFFNCLIASAIPNTEHTCVALACSTDGLLWQFHCSPSGVQCKGIHQYIANTTSLEVSNGGEFFRNKGYPRSMIWRFADTSLDEISWETSRQFFLLTDCEIQCFVIKFVPNCSVSKLWSHEIFGPNGELGFNVDFAGEKEVWPLDMQVDNHGQVISILIATFRKDRGVYGSSYIVYSLLTMQYKSRVNISLECTGPIRERVLERKAIQVILPKARIEELDFLLSMRCRRGGKPSGSTIILSGDGIATVAYYWRNSNQLFNFGLPYDTGKVLDASVLPSDGDDDGAWVILTERAGVWAIPEKAVLLGGYVPPGRTMLSNGNTSLSFSGNIDPRSASSEAWDAGDRQRAVFTGIAHRTSDDEKSEALLNDLFNDFLLSGQVDGSLDKLKSSGAFEKDGETNVFARVSKSIVDALGKNLTTTRGAEIVAKVIVSTQLKEKKQKHQKFLQFLSLSKCHEELCSRQGRSLLIILEHGEKLTGMIKLRELQNMISQDRSTGLGSPFPSPRSESSGALWDLIQLVGERAHRNNILLMFRDNAEVFYNKVSDLEEVFLCLNRELEYVISMEMPFEVQIQKACELSNAGVILVHTAMHYRKEHHMLYPSPEGSTPWYCQPMVCSGLWSIAAFMLRLLNGTSCGDMSAKSDFHSHLEAYYGAIKAKVERGEAHKGLLDLYCNRRDKLLDSLYQQVKCLARYQDLNEGIEEQNEGIKEQNEVILRQLSSKLLSIADQHDGYQTLWNLCCDLNDSKLLRILMRGDMGPKGGFTQFVFKQLYENKKFSKLLRLGEEFQEELYTFLEQYQDLLCLNEEFLHQFSSASKTLHLLALPQNGSSISAAEDARLEPTLKERMHGLSLSKIAVMAGKNCDCETKFKRIEAESKILNLQEQILKLLPDSEERQKTGNRLLPSADLIKLCLKGQNVELSLLAFDVFAWTSSSFLKYNRSLLEECWKNAASLDAWERYYQMSMADEWSEEDKLRALGETVLFQASSRCYGPKAVTYNGGFDKVMPLLRKDLELLDSNDMGHSVETILMQHKDFPVAGKLMLTAITMPTS